MLKKSLFAIAVLALGSLMSTSPAMAQIIEITPFFGYRFGGDLDIEEVNETLEFDDDISFGLIFDVNITDNLQGEFQWSRQTSAASVSGGIMVGDQDLGDVDIDYYHGGIVYQFLEPGDMYRPFVLATLGATNFSPDRGDIDGETKFSFGFGGGVKIYVNETFGFRFQFRGFNTDTDVRSTGLYCGYYDCFAVSSEQWVWQTELTGGLIIAF